MIRLNHLEFVFNLLKSHLHGPVLSLQELDMLAHPLFLPLNQHLFLLFIPNYAVELYYLGPSHLHVLFVLPLKLNDLRDQQAVFVLHLAVQEVFLVQLRLQVFNTLNYQGSVGV